VYLGLCHKHGGCVKQSNRWAKYYFQKEVEFGHKAAKKELKNCKMKILQPT